jgi:hypothetical protein
VKIISLNLWGGKVYNRLEGFIKARAPTTDVFCFQELFDGDPKLSPGQIAATKKYAGVNNDDVYDLASRIDDTLLPRFNRVISRPYSELGNRLGIFYSKRLPVFAAGEVDIADPVEQEIDGAKSAIGAKMQWVSVDGYGVIAHCHGIWQMGGKDDTPERLMQSRRLVVMLETFPGEKILVGDFNLNPDTKSVAILSKKMRNLIAEYGVKTTRSNLALPSKGKIADYAFVTAGVKVKEFQVLSDVVSDHLPIYLETG